MEAYAFLALFTIQILALSVLHPSWFIHYLRKKFNLAEREPDAQRYIERRLTQYRALNTGIAVIGVVLLGWLINYTRDPSWDDGPVEALLGMYFVFQMLPLCLVYWVVARINKELSLAQPKRKASLQRRGLLDFVSPATLVLAAVVYCLYAALVMYASRNPFPGFAGALTNIVVITVLYAVMALGVYVTLYHTKTSPLETQAERMRAIGYGVKISVYVCIASVVSLSLNMLLILLDLQRWEPFGLTIFYVAFALALAYSARTSARPRNSTTDEHIGQPPC